MVVTLGVVKPPFRLGSQKFHKSVLEIFTARLRAAARLLRNEKSPLVRRATYSLPRVARLRFPRLARR